MAHHSLTRPDPRHVRFKLVERRHTVDEGQATGQLEAKIDSLVLALYGIDAEAFSHAVARAITG